MPKQLRKHRSAAPDAEPSLSPAQENAIAAALDQLPQLGTALAAAHSREEAIAAIAQLSALGTASLVVFLERLGRRRELAAAQVVAAFAELSAVKEVRREARRALLRLRSAGIEPDWSLPELSTPQAPAPTASLAKPRFWQGLVSSSRQEGEVNLLLTWDLSGTETRLQTLAFLLDFWNAGIKDVIVTAEMSRSQYQRQILKYPETKEADFRPCTLEQGRWLVREALDFCAWRGLQPAATFQRQQLTIDALLDLNGEVDESADEIAIDANLDPDEVVANLIGAWSFGDYGLVYTLLASSHSLRRAQSRDEFVQLRRRWYDEAQPRNMVLNVIEERSPDTQRLWVPGGMRMARQEIDMFWSLVLDDSPIGGQLEELPFASLIHPRTRRHWYWTSYSLMREPAGWRVASQRDEAMRAQMEPIPDLEKHVTDLTNEARDLLQTHSPTGSDANEIWRHASILGLTALHYQDAVLAKLPLEEANYLTAAEIAQTFALYDRATAYFLRAADRFPGRAAWLRRAATVQELAGIRAQGMGQESQATELFEAALETWREFEQIVPGMEAWEAIGNLLLNLKRYDEAETVLHRMLEEAPDRAETVAALGALELARGHHQEALRHYTRAAQLNPDLPGIYFDLGLVYRSLGQDGDARSAYEEALRREPDSTAVMNNLASQYLLDDDAVHARELLARAVELDPNNALYRANLAIVAAHAGDWPIAHQHLQVAEELAPELSQVKVARSLIRERGHR
jgi:tetratricopeptide (TPR) repeat protein